MKAGNTIRAHAGPRPGQRIRVPDPNDRGTVRPHLPGGRDGRSPPTADAPRICERPREASRLPGPEDEREKGGNRGTRPGIYEGPREPNPRIRGSSRNATRIRGLRKERGKRETGGATHPGRGEGTPDPRRGPAGNRTGTREPAPRIYEKDPGNPRRGSTGIRSNSVSGDALLSHTLSSAVPSPCKALASGFGMGPGVSPWLWSPQIFNLSPPPRGDGGMWRFGNRTMDANSFRGPNGCSLPREQAEGRNTGNTRNKHGALCDCLSPVSTGQLHPLRGFHVRPIDHVFCMGGRAARGPRGILISEQASRLDAFSGYPFRT